MEYGGPRQRWVLDDRDLSGERGQQAHGSAYDVVEVGRALEEAVHRAALGRAERLDRRQPVDEEPVALVGRDAAGAGVRLGDVALVLERCHVVAHGGRRDAEVVPLGDRLAAHGLAGADEVLDDGTQDLELALVEHPPPPPGTRLG
jgi:hypothetical protein